MCSCHGDGGMHAVVMVMEACNQSLHRPSEHILSLPSDSSGPLAGVAVVE